MDKFRGKKDNEAVNIIFVLSIIAILVYAMVMAILYINSFLHNDIRNQVESAGLNESQLRDSELENIVENEYKYSVKNGEAKLLGLSGIESELIENNKLTIPESVSYGEEIYKVTEIESEAFRGNNLESVNIPSTVKKIGKSAFRENNIRELYLGNSVEIIEENAFADNSLSSIDIPQSVNQVKRGAFLGNKIMEVQIGEKIQLDDWAINGRFSDAYFFSLGEKGKYIREDEYLYSWKIVE